MKEKHANTVGNDNKVKKHIYVIRNDVNNKMYVGQTKDVKERFKNHCKKNDSIIGNAIQTIGKEHFWIEILEENVDDPDEREIYWINTLRTKVPYGYNLSPGGHYPPRNNLLYTEGKLFKIKDQLINTKMSLSEIAIANGISKRQVLRINQGLIYFNNNETYPLRKIPNINGILTEEDVDAIIDLLKYTYYYDGYIADQFGVEVHVISNINKGTSHHRNNIKYPIRNWKSCGVCPFTYDDVTDIMYLLKNTDLSMHQIAKRYNVGLSPIETINNGTSKKYRRDGVRYPIRSYRRKKPYKS